MGKYQLDYKGMQQVERYHEKNATLSKMTKSTCPSPFKKSWKEEIR